MLRKTAGPSLGVKPSRCSSSHCILCHHSRAGKQWPVSLKNVLDEAVKIIHLANLDPEFMCFNIVCDKMRSTRKSHSATCQSMMDEEKGLEKNTG